MPSYRNIVLIRPTVRSKYLRKAKLVDYWDYNGTRYYKVAPLYPCYKDNDKSELVFLDGEVIDMMRETRPDRPRQ